MWFLPLFEFNEIFSIQKLVVSLARKDGDDIQQVSYPLK